MTAISSNSWSNSMNPNASLFGALEMMAMNGSANGQQSQGMDMIAALGVDGMGSGDFALALLEEGPGGLECGLFLAAFGAQNGECCPSTPAAPSQTNMGSCGASAASAASSSSSASASASSTTTTTTTAPAAAPVATVQDLGHGGGNAGASGASGAASGCDGGASGCDGGASGCCGSGCGGSCGCD